MQLKALLFVIATSLIACTATAQERTPQPAPQISKATAEETIKASQEKGALLDGLFLPEIGVGSDPTDRHDSAAFNLHGLYGEAGWFYHNKGHRSVLLIYFGSDAKAIKYWAIDRDGNEWLFVITKLPDVYGGHQVWIDEDPSDATGPVHFGYVVEAK
ncbi:hypothetical protein [Aeoliella sp.]|uniref:hypothetical protein n=1 Tax=Aeoliella sp. TaxID=2795800 RepID=UPI003CCBD31B